MTAPVWDTAAIISWLEDIGVLIPLVAGPYVPDMPDVVGVVTPIAGAGLTDEGLFDTAGFQLRVRGSQNYGADAETEALTVDRLIVFSTFPARTSSGVYLLSVTRSGGRPAPIFPAPDDGDRYVFAATYLTRVALEPAHA